MSKAIIPPDELERLAALRNLNILDTDPEVSFDSITLIAKTLFQLPVSAISLVDTDRQWFKSMAGLSWSQTTRDEAFCAHTILGDNPLIVPDATADPAFKDNPLVVGKPGIRFYAGVPLNTREGSKIGSLCVIDTKPRADWSPLRTAMLTELGRMVAREIEVRSLRQRERTLLAENAELKRQLSRRETREEKSEQS